MERCFRVVSPSSALPIGAFRMLGELRSELVVLSQPGAGVVNSYLALLSIEDSHPTDEEILTLSRYLLVSTHGNLTELMRVRTVLTLWAGNGEPYRFDLQHTAVSL